MSNTGYDAPDNSRPSRTALPESQRRGGKAASRKRKRAAASRQPLAARERDLQLLKKIVDNMPDIREDRVAAAQHALQAGTLELRGEVLAEKLLRDLLLKPPPEA